MDECKPLVTGTMQQGCALMYDSRAEHRGKAVQVDPNKPKLKPPGTKRLKLKK